MIIDLFSRKEIKTLQQAKEDAIKQYDKVVEQNRSLQQENMFLRNVIKEFCVQFTKRHGNHFTIVQQLEKVVK